MSEWDAEERARAHLTRWFGESFCQPVAVRDLAAFAEECYQAGAAAAAAEEVEIHRVRNDGIAALRERAERAEAERDALRERLRALVERWREDARLQSFARRYDQCATLDGCADELATVLEENE